MLNRMHSIPLRLRHIARVHDQLLEAAKHAPPANPAAGVQPLPTQAPAPVSEGSPPLSVEVVFPVARKNFAEI